MGFHYSPHLTTDGLVMYLDGAQFTSGSTIWRDISRGNFNSASLINGPIYNPTNSLGSVTTDGSNDYILPPRELAGFEYGPHWDLNWTIDMWLKPDWSIGPQAYKYIYSGYYGVPFVVQGGGIVLFNANTPASAYVGVGMGGESVSVSTPAIPNLGSQNNNKWMHFAVTSNGVDVKTYYNGVLQNTTVTNWSSSLGRVNCVEDIKIDSNGKILVGGSFYKYKDEIIGYGLTRLNTDGTRDTTFNPPAFAYKVISIALSGSVIYPGGWYRYTNPNPGAFNIESLISINNTGSRIDYLRTGLYDQHRINATKAHPINGKIYFGATTGFIRLNPNLTADTTWAGGTTNGEVHAVDIDATGSLYVGGNLTTYSGSTNNRIFKATINGPRDATFNSGTGFNGIVRVIKVDSGDKIYCGGDFTTYSGSSAARIGRLNPNGTLDTTFNIGAGANNSVTAITIDNNGKIYIGGVFTSYSGSTINRIARLNPNGTIDTSFNIGTGFDNWVKTIAVDSNNKIYVGGNFYTYSGSAVNGIVKLNEDGTIDNTFNSGVGFTRANARPISTVKNVFDTWPSIGGNVIGYTKIEVGSFKIYNKTLSPQEIGQNYSATRGRYEE